MFQQIVEQNLFRLNGCPLYELQQIQYIQNKQHKAILIGTAMRRFQQQQYSYTTTMSNSKTGNININGNTNANNGHINSINYYNASGNSNANHHSGNFNIVGNNGSNHANNSNSHGYNRNPVTNKLSLKNAKSTLSTNTNSTSNQNGGNTPQTSAVSPYTPHMHMAPSCKQYPYPVPQLDKQKSNTTSYTHISNNYSNNNHNTTNISHHNNKQSIKDLLVAARTRNHYSENYISMTYQDIRIPNYNYNPTGPKGKGSFISNLLCGFKANHDIGCRCTDGRCPWFEHWLSLAMKNPILSPLQPTMSAYSNSTMVPPSIQQQIRKDLPRTQPNSPSFQTKQFQQALYQSLISYAHIDPQLSYIQGMNLISSIVLYHSYSPVSSSLSLSQSPISLSECNLIMRFLMIACHARQLYLNDFAFTKKLTNSILNILRYRLADLNRHLDRYNVNLSIFILGWLLPLLSNIIPIESMHMVLNTFIQKSWQGLSKIIISMLLYMRPIALELHDQMELMELFSIQGIKMRSIPWEEVIMSAANVRVGGLFGV